MRGNANKILTVTLVLCVVLLVGGCGFFNNPVDPEQSKEHKKQQEAFSEYEIITDAEQLPVEVKSLADYLKNQRGYFVFTPHEYATGEDTYLFISSGEKPTGGYALTVDSAAVAGDTLEIKVQEKEPAAGEGVVQVLTFPHLIVKIGSGYQNYRIINDKNEIFAAIPAETVPEIVKKKGLYVGQIDSNFIEIEVDSNPQSFMFGPETTPLLEDLQTGDTVFVSYFKNAHGQQVIVTLEKE